VGFYSKYIFPLVLDWSLDTPEMGEYRRRALALAHGETLEIGSGTGLNLPHYPKSVTRLVIIDSEDVLRKRVEKRIAATPVPVTRMRLDATHRLPFEDHSFDTVVTTLTLCSISDLAPALAEVRRVLKPGGLFIFFEHGRSSNPEIARRQDRFNPIQRLIAAGCNLNRPIDQLIESAGFEIGVLNRFLMPNTPRIMAEIYCGVAGLPGNLTKGGIR
jgi:ubiquinone/menaquinone biosynthesis C-methylase UbiE